MSTDPASPDRRRLLGASLGAGLAAAVPALMPSAAHAAGDPLVVGGLAVTCNLTLPVACAAFITRFVTICARSSPR